MDPWALGYSCEGVYCGWSFLTLEMGVRADVLKRLLTLSEEVFEAGMGERIAREQV